MTEATYVKTAYFAAPPDTVWTFLTDKDKLSEWFFGAESNLAPDSEYALFNQDKNKMCWGQVLEFDQPKRLVYTFTIAPMNGAMTTVHWILEPVAGGTKLTLRHEGLDTADSSMLGLVMSLDAGWDKHIAGLRAAIKG